MARDCLRRRARASDLLDADFVLTSPATAAAAAAMRQQAAAAAAEGREWRRTQRTAQAKARISVRAALDGAVQYN